MLEVVWKKGFGDRHRLIDLGTGDRHRFGID
jgi:hypothetical protein